jgi:hypothetical protein
MGAARHYVSDGLTVIVVARSVMIENAFSCGTRSLITFAVGNRGLYRISFFNNLFSSDGHQTRYLQCRPAFNRIERCDYIKG